MVVNARYKSLCTSLPYSAKQQREMTKFWIFVFWRTRTTATNFSNFHLEFSESWRLID